MKDLTILKFLVLFLSLNLLMNSRAVWGAEKKSVTEQRERNVDAAALSAQEKSEAKLAALLNKYRHTAQEPIFLQKLANLQQQEAAMRFRIAHGVAHRSQLPLDLSAYKSAMRRSITTLSEIIEKFPTLDGVSQSYFMRGKAFEEIEDPISAAKDYGFLTAHYPDAEEAPSAFMALADFSITANDHARAILFLTEVEKRPETPHYPFALYKLAWSYYNIKDIPKALDYIERNIDFYKKSPGTNADASSSATPAATSNDAFLENALLDSTVFFLEGFEQKLAQYQVSEALGYFKKLSNGNTVAAGYLGKMLYRFSKLLRAHGHEADLISWKNEIIAMEYQLPEALDVVLSTLENQANKRRYREQMITAQDIVALYLKSKGAYSFSKAQKDLLVNAELLQGIIRANKESTETALLSAVLAAIYDTFTKIAPEQDPRVAEVHYNLAETFFEIKNFEQATSHYRWVVEHRQKPAPGLDATQDADLKAVASQYERLRMQGTIPKELSPAMIQVNDKVADHLAKLNPEVLKWILWVDALQSTGAQYVFEANRLLYAQGLVQYSIDRLLTFVEQHPESLFAIPSATLILDTYVLNADWDKAYDLSLKYLDNVPLKFSNAKNLDFSNRLWTLSADSYFNRMARAYHLKNYSLTLKYAEKFVQLYFRSAHVAEALSLAGDAALKSGEKLIALNYYSRLIAEFSTSHVAPVAYAARAEIEEGRYQFSEAADDYRHYLESQEMSQDKSERADNLRKKTLLLSWLASDQSLLALVLKSQSICTQRLALDCEQFSALHALTVPTTSLKTKGLWAVVAMNNPVNLDFKTLLQVIKNSAAVIGDDSGTVDPLVRFTLVANVTVAFSKALKAARIAITRQEPLRTTSIKATEKHITRRIELITEMEAALTEVVKLPWMRIRASAINEMAWVYSDLAHDLRALATDDESIQKVVLPFEEKGSDMRAKAFEIASQSSIEAEPYEVISNPFFLENPSQAQALKKLHVVIPQQKIADNLIQLNGTLLKRLDSEDWITDEKDQENVVAGKSVSYMKVRWLKALQKKHLPELAFFTQELTQKVSGKRPISLGAAALMHTVTLAEIGAQAEALNELQESQTVLSLASQKKANDILIYYRWSTYSVFKGSSPEVQAASH